MNIIPKAFPKIPKYTEGQRATLYVFIIISSLAQAVYFFASASKSSSVENIRILTENANFYKEAYNKKDEECNELKRDRRNFERQNQILDKTNTTLLIENTRLKNILTIEYNKKTDILKSAQ